MWDRNVDGSKVARVLCCPDTTKFLTLYVLDIPDDYGYMDAELVQLIRIAADPFIDDFPAQSPT